MKGVSIRVEDDLHYRLRLVVLQKDTSIQEFVLHLLEDGVKKEEREISLKRENEVRLPLRALDLQ